MSFIKLYIDIKTYVRLLSDSEILAKERFIQIISKTEHCIKIAVLNNFIVGYAWVQNYGSHLRTGKTTARLHDLFVTLNQRKKGIGSLLFQSVRDWAKTEGVTWLQWQANYSSISFYEKLGFKGDSCPDPNHPFFEIEF